MKSTVKDLGGIFNINSKCAVSLIKKFALNSLSVNFLLGGGLLRLEETCIKLLILVTCIKAANDKAFDLKKKETVNAEN